MDKVYQAFVFVNISKHRCQAPEGKLMKIETDSRVKIERYNSILERSPIRKKIFLMFSLDESLQSTRIEGGICQPKIRSKDHLILGHFLVNR